MSALGNVGAVIAAIVANPHATIGQLADEVGTSERTVRRHVATLERRGAFTRTYTQGGRTHYHLNRAYVLFDHITIGDVLDGRHGDGSAS